MTFEEVKNLFLQRQSCRSFNGQAVDKETIQKICEAGTLSPSACNAQPWKIIAVTGEKCKQIAVCMQRLGMNKFASNAGAFLVLAQGKSNLVASVSGNKEQFTLNDLGMLTAHLVLAAESLGVASCILGWRDEKKLCEMLSLAKNTRIPHVIALGYPTENYEIRPKKRKDLEEVLTFVE